jgi:hypothetical protein
MKVFLFTLCVLMGCAGQSKPQCGVTGASVACACPGGGTGAQVCQSDGSYGACNCGESVAERAAADPKGGCDALVGKWRIDDEVFDIQRASDGDFSVVNAPENEEVTLTAREASGTCELRIVMFRNHIASGTPDMSRYIYDAKVNGNELTGTVQLCDFGTDYDELSESSACPREQSSDDVRGVRE